MNIKFFKEYCPYCWPTKRRYHFVLHIEYYGIKLVKFFEKIFRFNQNKKTKQRFFIKDFLSLLKIIKFEKKPDRRKIYNRSLIFFDEAKKRGLDIRVVKFFSKYINEFVFFYNNKKYYYEGIPTILLENKNTDMDDKNKVKKILNKNKIPTPSGQIFINSKRAFNFGKEIGYPLVVKPNSGSLSQHVICPVNSDEELKIAIKIVKIYKPDFIVEEYIQGRVYRATIVNKKHVFVCLKEKVNIIGDGVFTIRDLINFKNNDKKRGETYQKDTTLHKISIDDTLKNVLQKQGLKLDSILNKNQKVYLNDKCILSCGCDIINCGDVHLDNKNLFLEIAKILNTNLVGIDFICPDISCSYKNQKTGVLETNSLPYIDMHQHPSCGKSYSVAKIVWDELLNKIQ